MSKKKFEDPTELVKEYQSGQSSKKLAEKYETSEPTILSTLRRAGVKIRTLTEAHKFRDIRGDKNPNYGGGCFGEKNGNWKGGVNYYHKDRWTNLYMAWKKFVWIRDKFTCVLCGNKNKKILVAHHIVGWNKDKSLRHDPNNGITLCNSCHGKVSRKESEYVTLFKEIVKIRV